MTDHQCPRHRVCTLFARTLACALALGHALCAQAASWSPQKNVEIVVGTAPGSGVDRPARVIQKIIQDQRLVSVTTAVVNKPGAGGAIAYNYLGQQAGDGHYIGVVPPTLLTNHITGKSALKHTDLTAIALLASEYVAFAVRADSPIRSAKDLGEVLRRDPRSISIGIGTSVGNNNHTAIAQFARKVGADVARLKTVAFNSQNEVLTALLGGHLELMSTAASNLVAHMSGDKLRVIALAGPQRGQGVLASAPTLKEQGFDVVARQWRVVVGPAALKPDQVAYWENVFGRLVDTDDWRKYLERVANESTFLSSKDTQKFLDAEYSELRAALKDLGLAK